MATVVTNGLVRDAATGALLVQSSTDQTGSAIPWANRPSAATSGYNSYFVCNDIRADGVPVVFVSDGTYWRSQGYIPLKFSAMALPMVADLLRHAAVSYVSPAGLLTPNSRLNVVDKWSRQSGDGAAHTFDVTFGGTTLFSSAIASRVAVQFVTQIANRNSLTSQIGERLAGSAITDTGVPQASASLTYPTASVDTANATTIEIGFQYSGSFASAVTLESYSIELLV